VSKWTHPNLCILVLCHLCSFMNCFFVVCRHSILCVSFLFLYVVRLSHCNKRLLDLTWLNATLWYCASWCDTILKLYASKLTTYECMLNVCWLQFGVSDTEGGVCLWQVGLGLGSVGMNKPYLVRSHALATTYIDSRCNYGSLRFNYL